MIIHLENENYDEIVNNGLVVVDFFATWCGPCQMLSPILENFSKETSDIDIVKVDIDSCGDLAIKYDIEAVPTLILFKNGTEIDRTLGFLDENELKNFINKYKE